MRSRSTQSGDAEKDRSATADATRRSRAAPAARAQTVDTAVPVRGRTASAGRQTAWLGAFEELGQLARTLNERERGREASWSHGYNRHVRGRA